MDNIIVERSKRAFLLAKYGFVLRMLFAGGLLPLSFAPFHYPGLAILGIALFFAELYQQPTKKNASLVGFIFGTAYMGFGVTWIYVSIHLFGHLNWLLSGLITCLFIAYLASFFAFFALLFQILSKRISQPMMHVLLFSALWCLVEYLRATCFSGFPWLLVGFGQMDSPFRYLIPIVGLYGVGFLTCFSATCLVMAFQYARKKHQQSLWLVAVVFIMLTPKLLKPISWSQQDNTPISVAIIQANLSMRDKWDERLFWSILDHYQQRIHALIGQKNLILLPEAAIPMPANYLSDWIHDINLRTAHQKSSLLMGIPKPTSAAETHYYNTLSAYGLARGSYFKQHLVPFGEYTPKPFIPFMTWLKIPEALMQPGQSNQTPITVAQHPIATLICYELAYPTLLKKQLPKAEWIVSVSDDGWFGHSLAMYQQLQMAQALAIQTARYHLVANNDGLSSIINTEGNIIATLPAFTSGVLEGNIYPSHGSTPWVRIGDTPVLFLAGIIVLIAFFSKRRYPYQSARFDS